MALSALPLWLFLVAFVIAMALGGVLIWYLLKLLWYLVGRARESEFDRAPEAEVLAARLRVLVGQAPPC